MSTDPGIEALELAQLALTDARPFVLSFSKYNHDLRATTLLGEIDATLDLIEVVLTVVRENPPRFGDGNDRTPTS